MTNLAIITTPLQLLNLSEYFYLFPEDNDTKIVAFIKKDRSNHQIQAISELLKINISETIYIDKGKHFITLKKLARKTKTIDKLILGQFFSDPILFLSNNIAYKELVILDDGLANIHVPNAIETKMPIIKPSKLNTIAKLLLGINTKFPNKATLFTLFKINETSNIRVIKNQLLKTQKLISIKPVSNEIILIGQPYVEIDEISLTDYLKLLNSVCNYFREKKITYLAHRRENDSKLLKISQDLNIEIVTPKYNFELYLAQRDTTPSNIIGFTSTALITASLLTSQLESPEILAIKLPTTIILRNTSKIMSCYNEIAQNNINVLSIE